MGPRPKAVARDGSASGLRVRAPRARHPARSSTRLILIGDQLVPRAVSTPARSEGLSQSPGHENAIERYGGEELNGRSRSRAAPRARGYDRWLTARARKG